MVWNLLHLGGPTHPVHIHMAKFQLLARRKFKGNVDGVDVALGSTATPLEAAGDGAPERYEEGRKDTFEVRAGEWVTVAGQFTGTTGDFMYHCHIRIHIRIDDHKDKDKDKDKWTMRPFVVMPPDVAKFHVHHGSQRHH
ncbi:MAG TPA: multicopper oxidase domain-containing protein [Amycolatopsis sp.]|uniref:multicopper oxidase domain-containing protein n=1 Tax=Amycolatopsis sp. TaxID=37632 RepID=UPI002B48F38B|nr:multicopper oxidase domain-containing protein [Amycolatopsis sp.]HKS48425.1 multicopper oxidase domain-containing protein [Amycolatopsis sp.]